MQNTEKQEITAKGHAANKVIDHLVDALGGEPACKLMRAMILADIDHYPATNQAEIMERLGGTKSSLNRDIEWLYDYGCITRKPSLEDSRAMELRVCGYAKKNIDLALAYFDFQHENLKNFLQSLISIFGQHKPTLRDAKIVSVIGKDGTLTRQQILESLYNGPTTTDNRAVNNLINFGLVQSKSEEK